MGNPLPKKIHLGTLGELLVQLRLLEYDIQAAPPIKDSGNDLIAIKGEVIKFVQVKSSPTTIARARNLPEVYHIVALVELKFSNERLLLDESKIYVYKKGESVRDKRELTQDIVNELWAE